LLRPGRGRAGIAKGRPYLRSRIYPRNHQIAIKRGAIHPYNNNETRLIRGLVYQCDSLSPKDRIYIHSFIPLRSLVEIAVETPLKVTARRLSLCRRGTCISPADQARLVLRARSPLCRARDMRSLHPTSAGLRSVSTGQPTSPRAWPRGGFHERSRKVEAERGDGVGLGCNRGSRSAMSR